VLGEEFGGEVLVFGDRVGFAFVRLDVNRMTARARARQNSRTTVLWELILKQRTGDFEAEVLRTWGGWVN
jgi:hypothetical protein